MSAFEIDDAVGRRLWSGLPRPPLGCPGELPLASYADRRADPDTEAAVEAALAGCRETTCLCLEAVAAARQPGIEPVRPEIVAAAQALVAPQPLRRVGVMARWAAAAAAVLLAAQLGFNLGMATAGYADAPGQGEESAVSTWADWSASADL